MPPKISAKAIAAEIKKKNTAEANDIVAMMKRAAEKKKPSASKTAIMEQLFGSSSTDEMAKTGNSDAVDNPPKKPQTEVVLKHTTRKDTVASQKAPKKPEKEVVLKQNTRKDTVASQKTSKKPEKEVVLKQTARNDTVAVDESGVDEIAIDLTGLSNSGIEREIRLPEKHNTRKTFGRKADQIATGSKELDKGKSSNPKHSTKRTKSGHGTGYQYEIDCKKVSDSIDVTDLKRYLETQLKVNGHKNNFGSTVTISCEGQKVVIKSKVFLPKKSLRFLSKKFLKRNWNIRVVSKNVHSYEYQYVGTL